MVGGENIFAPPTKLVVFMFASVRVWVVMRFDGSRRIHFRKKLSFQYLEGSPVCKAEKTFPRPKAVRAGGRALPTSGADVSPFGQARFRGFRNRGPIIMRGIVEQGQTRAPPGLEI